MELLAIGRDPNFRALAATGMIEGNIVAGGVVGRASSLCTLQDATRMPK
jgi:hypothetical protein